MRALDFWKTIAMDQADLLESLVALLTEHQIPYCIIGGQAVNAYAEPLVSLDLHLVISADQVENVELLCGDRFLVEHFPHCINVSLPGSDLRVQIQTDPRYAAFVQRASSQKILGLTLPVARLEDVLQGKIWAAMDPKRRSSKRQKDLADIARLLETHPGLHALVPAEILEHLL